MDVSTGAIDGELDRSTAPPASSGSRFSPRLRWGAAIGGAMILALIVFVLLFQWNWLRGPMARAISDNLHRPVTIAGNLEVHPWSWTPLVVLNDVTVGNPPWAGPGLMARVPRLSVRVKLLPLLGGKLDMPLAVASAPQVFLLRAPSGLANWDFTNGRRTRPPAPPVISHLIISQGMLRYGDPGRRISFAGGFSDEERAGSAQPGAAMIMGALLVANPAWAGTDPLARAPRLVVRMELLPLLHRQLVIPLVQADRPDIRLLRDAAGRANWSSGAPNTKPLKLPPISHLIITDGALRYNDARRRLNFVGTISSNEQAAGSGRGNFRLDGHGLLNGARLVARVTGGPLVNVDRTRPYLFDARIEAGPTRATLAGQFAHPFDFGQMSGQFGVSGPDFADLFTLTGLALPSTPPYDLGGGFGRSEAVYAFRGIHGRVGQSDLSGALTVNDTSGRPFVTADLASRRLLLADLAAVVGGVPKHAAGHPLSPSQKIMAAKLKAEHRILPDAHLAVDRVRGMDARLVYHAQSVQAGKPAISALSLNLVLDHGVITINPLDVTLPQGRLAGMIRIDASRATPSEAIDLRLTNARLETLVARRGANPPLEGGLYAHARLSSIGDSVRAAAAAADGEVTMAIPSGEIRQALAELLGIDVTKGLFLLISKNQGETPIRCAVADFRAQKGVLTAQRFVLDTGVVLAQGSGHIDLRNETLDLALDGKPKKFRLVRIDAPITIKGSLLSPKFGVDIAKAAPQALLSVAVGVLAAPLAAILPFVTPGTAKDANCPALLAQASDRGAPVAVARRR